MNSPNVTVDQIVHEVDDLHNLFVAWYAGEIKKDRDWYDRTIAGRMDHAFSIVGRFRDVLFEIQKAVRKPVR